MKLKTALHLMSKNNIGTMKLSLKYGVTIDDRDNRKIPLTMQSLKTVLRQ